MLRTPHLGVGKGPMVNWHPDPASRCCRGVSFLSFSLFRHCISSLATDIIFMLCLWVQFIKRVDPIPIKSESSTPLTTGSRYYYRRCDDWRVATRAKYFGDTHTYLHVSTTHSLTACAHVSYQGRASLLELGMATRPKKALRDGHSLENCYLSHHKGGVLQYVSVQIHRETAGQVPLSSPKLRRYP